MTDEVHYKYTNFVFLFAILAIYSVLYFILLRNNVSFLEFWKSPLLLTLIVLLFFSKSSLTYQILIYGFGIAFLITVNKELLFSFSKTDAYCVYTLFLITKSISYIKNKKYTLSNILFWTAFLLAVISSTRGLMIACTAIVILERRKLIPLNVKYLLVWFAAFSLTLLLPIIFDVLDLSEGKSFSDRTEMIRGSIEAMKSGWGGFNPQYVIKSGAALGRQDVHLHNYLLTLILYLGLPVIPFLIYLSLKSQSSDQLTLLTSAIIPSVLTPDGWFARLTLTIIFLSFKRRN